ncbi:MAG: mannose-6-phosphate isomerase [Bacteroidales bacterium]|nr:mannose-6-phosphate isomerase [Bacteroidales bacterium]
MALYGIMWKFTPILKHTLWGGSKIAKLKGMVGKGESIGESWEISSLAGSVSVVADGVDAGLSILQLIVRDKERLLGRRNYERHGDEFPLLVKFIDAEKDLSIQVHPDDAMASMHGHRGKTEMWYVVDAVEGTRICNGFRNRIDKSDYSQMVASGRIMDSLNYIDIAKDDVYYIPAGRIHAIGAGAFLVEVQQASDVTYRVYDYMRRDADGRLRELHVDLASEALDFEDVGGGAIAYEKSDDSAMTLMQTDYFTTQLYRLREEYVRDLRDLDSFVVITLTEGECRIIEGEESRVVAAGDTILIAAQAQSYTIIPNGSVAFVEAFIEA